MNHGFDKLFIGKVVEQQNGKPVNIKEIKCIIMDIDLVFDPYTKEYYDLIDYASERPILNGEIYVNEIREYNPKKDKKELPKSLVKERKRQ
jgi:hypothetical protein